MADHLASTVQVVRILFGKRLSLLNVLVDRSGSMLNQRLVPALVALLETYPKLLVNYVFSDAGSDAAYALPNTPALDPAALALIHNRGGGYSPHKGIDWVLTHARDVPTLILTDSLEPLYLAKLFYAPVVVLTEDAPACIATQADNVSALVV